MEKRNSPERLSDWIVSGTTPACSVLGGDSRLRYKIVRTSYRRRRLFALIASPAMLYGSGIFGGFVDVEYLSAQQLAQRFERSAFAFPYYPEEYAASAQVQATPPAGC